MRNRFKKIKNKKLKTEVEKKKTKNIKLLQILKKI